MSRRVQTKTRTTIKIVAGLTIDVYSGHIIIKARGFEFPIYSKDFHKFQKALEEAIK